MAAAFALPLLDQLLDDEVDARATSESGFGPPSHHSVYSLEEAEVALEERGVTPVWRLPGFIEGAAGTPRRTPWSLRERASDSDPKHAHRSTLSRCRTV